MPTGRSQRRKKLKLLERIKIDTTALAIAAAPLSLEEKIDWHLAVFKGVPREMSSVLCLAIQFFDMGVSAHKTLPLPNGVRLKGQTIASLEEIIEVHHLEPYLAIFAEYLPASPLEAPLLCS